jgi:hypothetical protein
MAQLSDNLSELPNHERKPPARPGGTRRNQIFGLHLAGLSGFQVSSSQNDSPP